MPAQALAALATLLSVSQHGNRTEMRVDRGAAEMVWVSPSSFRFRRSLDGTLPPAATPDPKEPLTINVEDAGGAVHVRSNLISVTINKHGLLIAVHKRDGSVLMEDASEPSSDGAAVSWKRRMPAGVRYYGLGPRAAMDFDLRGQTVATEYPFLVTSAGYGEYLAGTGPFRFDFSAPDSYRVQAPRVDYYFYYGARPKDIFEAHKPAGGFTALWRAPAGSARDTLLNLVQSAMSGILNPWVDLSAFDSSPPVIRQRARQVFSLAHHVKPGAEGLSGFRQQLNTFYGAYDPEVDYKGFPVWHALPFEFPTDAECAHHADEFMLGDEMLIAPILQGNSRSVYLPQGIWTNLETDAVVNGRQTITVETAALPVFARNGTIVPLDSPAGMALHYFPELGAEFFIEEPAVNDYTQVHAAPAGDEMRLEIESKVARDYQWVVHHVDRPSSVGFGGVAYREARGSNALADKTWYYDARQRGLMVRVHVEAKQDSIVNLTFPSQVPRY